jgi:hypothetical protein
MVSHAAYDAGVPVFRNSEFGSTFCCHCARDRISNRNATFLALRIHSRRSCADGRPPAAQARSIQRATGANSQAISALARLLQMPYYGGFYFETPVTSALLRLDPIWDPLRADPAFQKLCEEKAAVKRFCGIIADNLGKAGWSLGWVSALGSSGESVFIVRVMNCSQTLVD